MMIDSSFLRAVYWLYGLGEYHCFVGCPLTSSRGLSAILMLTSMSYFIISEQSYIDVAALYAILMQRLN